MIGEFLEYLESTRGNSVRTRNTRLAAIHSFFRHVAANEPAHALVCQRVLAIPTKRHVRRPIEFLTPPEIEAVLRAPDLSTWTGRRDRALLALAIQTGLRVSELIHLRRQDVVVSTGAHVRCQGKGRKERCTPLRKDTTSILRAWLRESNARPESSLFPGIRGNALSRDAVERLVGKHVETAREDCKSLRTKRITPHALRHTAAMVLLQHGVDRTVIALWLGHESVDTTQIYLHEDLRLKEEALARTTPTRMRIPRYRPGDRLLAFLEAL